MPDQISVRDVRNINKINILKTIMENRDIKRKEISNKNNISVMTVKNIVDDLLEKGVIDERKVDSGVGRKPMVLNINESIGYVLSIDISRKSLDYIIYDINRNKIREGSYKRELKEDYLISFSRFIQIIKVDLENLEFDLLGIGISVPGIYNREEDRVYTEIIKDLRSIKLKQLFEEEFDIENIIIEQDVKLAALVEVRNLKLRKKNNFYIFLGERVSGSLLINNEIYSGHNEIAGNIGRFLVDEDKTLEGLFSIYGIVGDIKEKLEGSDYDLGEGHDHLDFIDILNMYEKKNRIVVEHFKYIFKVLSEILHDVIWLINPENIVVRSIYGQFTVLVVKEIEERLGKLIPEFVPIKFNIIAGTEKFDGAFIGAYEMVINSWIEMV